METPLTYYDVLGVSVFATADELHAAYRARAKQWHPDAASANDEQMTLLNEAWEVLSSPQTKSAYDVQIGLKPDSSVSTSSSAVAPVPSSPLSAIVVCCFAFGAICVAVGFAGRAGGAIGFGLLLLGLGSVLTGYRFREAISRRR